MEIAKRMSRLEPSPTIALNTLAKSIGEQGQKVYNFAVGEPDFPTPKIIVDSAIKGLQDGLTKYGAAGGSLPLRKLVAEKLLRENKLDYSPEEIVVGIGAKEVLFHLFTTLLNDGDEVILVAPYWVSYADQIKLAGGVPIIVPLDSIDKPFDPEKIKNFFSDRTKAIVINSPNNPSGYVINPATWKALTQIVESKSCWIISDEIYEYLSFGSPYYSILHDKPNLKDRVITVNGLSKGYAMTGFRVGYLAAQKKVAAGVRNLISHSSTCLPSFIEKAAMTALTQGRELLREEWTNLEKKRDLAVSSLKKIPKLRTIEPQGAFYVFMDIREILAASGQTSMRFSENLLKEYHVAMVPGEAFGCPGFLRLSYVVAEQDLIEGVKRLKTALENLLK